MVGLSTGMSLSIVADFEVEGAGAGYAAMRRESSIKILAGDFTLPNENSHNGHSGFAISIFYGPKGCRKNIS